MDTDLEPCLCLEPDTPAQCSRLVAPQYACKLAFTRRVPKLLEGTSQALGDAEGASAAGGMAGGSGSGDTPCEVMSVEQNWHSACAVLSDENHEGGRRYLVAAAWSRAGGPGGATPSGLRLNRGPLYRTVSPAHDTILTILYEEVNVGHMRRRMKAAP